MPGARLHRITLAFVGEHPREAARVLETLPVGESVALLAQLPARAAAGVLREMFAPYAVRCAQEMAVEVAAPLFEALGAQAGAWLLQRLDHSRQSDLLEQMAVATAVSYRLLVGYPRDTAGSAMDPQALTLTPELRVAEALERIRDHDGDAPEMIFVVSGEHRLVGWMPPAEAVRAPAQTTLAKAMRPVQFTVPALASLASLVSSEGWEEHPVLPVVEREDRFVGALHRRALRRWTVHAGARQLGASGNMVSMMAEGYWLGMAALIEAVVSMIPVQNPATRNREDGDER